MENTTENNKLIAEFMGLWYAEENYLYNPQFEKGFLLEDLKYHTSWDWLMPVVDKIESIYLKTTVKSAFSVTQYEALCSIEIDPQVDLAFNNNGELGWVEDMFIDGTSRLDATYKAVVEFIKWYNQNK